MDKVSTRIIRMASRYTAAVSLILIGYLFYRYLPFYANFFAGSHDFKLFTIPTVDVFFYFFALNAMLLPLFHISLPPQYKTKSQLFWRFVFMLGKRGPNSEEKTAILSTLVKFFFLPLIIFWLCIHISQLIQDLSTLNQLDQFFPAGYWLIFNVILTVDVLFFMIGYSIEHPRLGNEIRSVDATLLGWIVALACYPPLNGMLNNMLGWYSSDYPGFTDSTWLTIIGISMLVLMAIYSSASVALNLKASNLTNRGIVRRGPYAVVRHPAYMAKNLAWWLGSIPVLQNVWQEYGFLDFLIGVLSVILWSGIYFLRAITEENHLKHDEEYRQYCEQVKYRFIPKII